MDNDGKFPYTVEKEYQKLNDSRCCSTFSSGGGWYWYRCTKTVKKIIDGIGFCGIHARSILNWRKK